MSATEPLATLTPLATSVTSPSTQTQGKIVTRRVLHLSDIPGAMDKMGWTVAAKLMRHWFSNRPAWEMPEEVRMGQMTDRNVHPINLKANQYDDQIVTFKWFENFHRFALIVRDLVENWASDAGKAELLKKLKLAGWKRDNVLPFHLGFGLKTGRELDSVCQVNYRGLGSKLDPLDDLYGALGMATLKVAVVGRVIRVPLTRRYEFHPEKIGIYVRDTYDFNPTKFETVMPLGVWNHERCLSKADTAAYLLASNQFRATFFNGFVPVFNSDFRRWQTTHNEGGDFVVYSDVKWIPISMTPIYLP